jgi:diguanylate cyclase (GGDEF)-like protein
MRRHTEPIDVYRALVSALADNVLPTAAIGAIFAGIGLYTYSKTGAAVAIGITVVGILATALKILLIRFHRRAMGVRPSSDAAVKRFELGHAITTWCMAAPVGALSALLFSLPALQLHVVGTALLFGYCAGVATRISARPLIAMSAVTIAAVPAIASALIFLQDARLLIIAVFALFLLIALETIWHIYGNDRRLITMRLQMANLARLDPLTSLHNRLGLREAFDALPRGNNGLIAVHAFDLDGFKAVNDQFGHATGDILLKAIAERLQQLVGQNHAAARVGGDEFVVLQPVSDRQSDAGALAGNIHRQLTEPYDVGTGRPITLGLSLGFSIAPLSTASLNTLMREADAASYEIKRNGGGFQPHPSPSNVSADLGPFAEPKSRGADQR